MTPPPNESGAPIEAGIPSESGAGAWRAQVEQELRGADFERSLVRTSLDGIEQAPVYSDAIDAERLGRPGVAPFRRGSQPPSPENRPWQLCTRIDATAPEQANAELLADLAGGADAAWLVAAPSTRMAGANPANIEAHSLRSSGVDFGGKASWERLLKDVQTELLTLHLDAGALTGALFQELRSLLDERGVAASSEIHLGFDPLAALARDGALPCSLAAARAQGWELLAQAQALPKLRVFAADGFQAHAAGASEATEIAVVLASLTETLRAADEAGQDLAQVAASTDLRIGVGSEVFLEIAKMRALRELWTRVCESCELEAPAPFLHAIASPRTLTRRDPWTNLLRSSTQGFAAAVAGADAITLLPMDSAFQRPGKLGRRMARNTQLVLAEEAHLGAITDPAGGSFAIEAWTDELVAAAWSTFQSIEAAGGLASCLQSGWLTENLRATQSQRATQIAKRRQPITGVSEFAQLEERLPDAGPQSPTDAQSWADSQPVPTAWQAWLAQAPSGEPAQCEALAPVRDAQAFEELRDAADAYAKEHGHAPRVCLATLGDLADHNARSTFASNLFAVGGFEAINLETAEEGAGSDAVAVCICGTDKAYQDYGADVVYALRELGAKHVLLAGKPESLNKDTQRKLKKLKLSGSISLGCDALEVLQQLHAALRGDAAFLEAQA